MNAWRQPSHWTYRHHNGKHVLFPGQACSVAPVIANFSPPSVVVACPAFSDSQELPGKNVKLVLASCPPPGDLPCHRTEPSSAMSSHSQAGFLLHCHQGFFCLSALKRKGAPRVSGPSAPRVHIHDWGSLFPELSTNHKAHSNNQSYFKIKKP